MVDVDSMHQQFVTLLASGATPDDLRDAVEAAIEAAVDTGMIPPELDEVEDEDES